MTISGYSSAIVDTMLGWLKGFANWVLKLFNLAGSAGASPLLWLSHNWLFLLVVLMAIGVAGDILVWLVRWRPHWVWFHKERVIVDDENFFNDSDIRDQLDLVPDDLLEKNWQERDYVVASTLVKQQGGSRSTMGAARSDSRRGRAGDTVVRRGSGSESKASFKRGERRRGSAAAYEAHRKRLRESEEKARRIRSERERDLFGLDGNQPDVTDFYEDEVFNVNNLPRVNDFPFEDTQDLEER